MTLPAFSLLAVLWAAQVGATDEGAPAEAASAEQQEGEQDEGEAGKEDEPRWDPVGVPIVSYNTDEGFGLGATVGLHHQSGGVTPYRDDLALNFFITTRLIQRYELRWEGLQVLDLPLRVRVLTGLFSTATRNFCGFGNGVTCSVARAEREADLRDLSGDVRDTYVRRFYQVRFLRPYADVVARWRLFEDLPLNLEAMGGWRFAWHIPGDFTHREPYPGSLYGMLYPEGERGPSSVLQAGLVLDERDFEPLPVRGWFAEASVRAATPAWGSAFHYTGANASLAGWHPVGLGTDVVAATRVLVDVIGGAPPTDELAETGGIYDYPAFGGMWIGRGIRANRYLGKLKVINQTELRGFLGDINLFNTQLDGHWVLFADLAWIGADWDDLEGGIPGRRGADVGHPLRILATGGAGLRILVRRTFVVRLEVGVSPFERLDPTLYTPVGTPF